MTFVNSSGSRPAIASLTLVWVAATASKPETLLSGERAALNYRDIENSMRQSGQVGTLYLCPDGDPNRPLIKSIVGGA
jgi:hypothetical protein